MGGPEPTSQEALRAELRFPEEEDVPPVDGSFGSERPACLPGSPPCRFQSCPASPHRCVSQCLALNLFRYIHVHMYVHATVRAHVLYVPYTHADTGDVTGGADRAPFATGRLNSFTRGHSGPPHQLSCPLGQASLAEASIICINEKEKLPDIIELGLLASKQTHNCKSEPELTQCTLHI